MVNGAFVTVTLDSVDFSAVLHPDTRKILKVSRYSIPKLKYPGSCSNGEKIDFRVNCLLCSVSLVL